MSAAAAIARLAETLENARIAYMLTDSCACVYYGATRGDAMVVILRAGVWPEGSCG